ncbi:MAG: Pyoverdin chromophore biosynthetic protein pvcC, partial [Caldilineaceae bacterium]|nr:Pyoverdin chromophore biosynthetic protein pvcC [Caldilineaceae bacterium]
MTGDEYLESLRDGREVWIYGARVEDVTAHPAFRNQARMVARLYDMLHDPAGHASITTPTDTGSGGYTHAYFRAAYTQAEQVAARDALAAWHRVGFGWMGRAPDYMAGLLGLLGANADLYAPFDENARRWYRTFQERMPYVNHALVNPPVDRHRPPDEVDDVYIHVVRETDAGIVVSGAKNITTNAALTNYSFVAHDGGAPVKRREFAATFLLPVNTPGVKMICRPSYEMRAGGAGTPFDYPLSGRFDENDAIFILDEVLVPWENVLIYGDLEKYNKHMRNSGFYSRSGLQSATRMAVKLDLITGLLLKATETTGVQQFRGVQVNIGEVMTYRHLFWALSDALAHSAVAHNGVVIPKLEHMMAHRMMMTTAYPRVREIVSQLVASGLIFHPSSARDFQTPELQPYLEKYMRGSNTDAVTRTKLMKTLWDAVGTEFGGRHELYERNNLGNHEAIRLHAHFQSIADGTEESLKAFADTCLDEFDLDG